MSSPASRAIASLITERAWQAQVTDLAKVLGWPHAYFRPARTERGWRTPVSGPKGAGFPDLVLVRGDRLVFAELKAQDGRLTPDQRHVLGVLGKAAECHVWRPADLNAVLEVLR